MQRTDNVAVPWPLVEELPSRDRRWRAEIRRREDGNLQVFLLRWVVESLPGYGHMWSGWVPLVTEVSIIANELLTRHAAES